MHLIVLAEALPQTHRKFIEWLESLQHSTGGHPVVREIKLYDITFKESDQERYLKMLLRYESAGHVGMDKLELLGRIVRRLFKIEDLTKEKQRILKNMGPRTKQNLPFKGGWIYLYIIGKIKDPYKDGVEGI